MSGARRGVVVVVAAAAAFGVLALAAAAAPVPMAVEGTGGWVVEPRGSSADDADASSDDQDAAGDEQSTERGTVLSSLVDLAAFVALIVVTVLIVRAVSRRLVAPAAHADPLDLSERRAAPSWDLAEAVEEGLTTLESGPVDDAVVACWLRLEQAAAGAGVARLPSETPAELTVRLFARFDVPRPAVHRLLELYRTARYSRHRLGEVEREEAITSLRTIGVAMERASA